MMIQNCIWACNFDYLYNINTLIGLFLRNVKFSSTHESIEQQGSVSSPLRCSITTDSLGKDILSNFQLSQALYKFKGFLPIPPLLMIDNILTVSRCGFDSLLFFSVSGEALGRVVPFIGQ